jgi:hypothetical protein
MDEQAVRDRAEAFGAALVAGDVERAIESLSAELRRNLGEVVALLPLPASEATIESFEHSGSGDNVVLRLVGENDETSLLTRWKDRDGQPTIIELSHLSTTAQAPDLDEVAVGETGDTA